MSLRAYQQVAQRAESPRDAEYRLFAQVTRALMDLKTTPREDARKWMDILAWNRQLWSTLALDCASPSNALPAETRGQIMSLSMWVGRHTSAVMRRSGELEPLIDVNRMMMQGLASRPESV